LSFTEGETQAVLNAALLIFSALLFGGAPVAVNAQDFQDKTIRFVVGYSPGGLFDLYTRVIARHFAKHARGNPTVIVENMTGASGIIAANYVYNVAKPDGLTIGVWAAPLVLQHIMGNEALRFDGRKFSYLGVPSPYDTVCTVNEKSAVANMDDWFAPPNGR
jgi:tripartite-type tricarboxylate transporter receptor subunit TctC